MGVKLNSAQRRWFRLCTPVDQWRWQQNRIIHLAANQVGKTLGLAILILWANHNKIGVDPSDHEVWLKTPYQWFHLAPNQQTAYLTLDDITLLVKGAHPAQYDKATGEYRKPRLPEAFFTFEKVEQYYRGLTLWNGAIVQFRTTEDKVKALQGRRAHGISFDECAYEAHLIEIIDATLEMRLISTGGPLWLVSTPNGINDYFEIVTDLKEHGRTSFDGRVWTTDDKRALVWSTIDDNVGYGLSQSEVDRKEATLGETIKEQALRGAFLEPAEAFFVPAVEVEKAFRPIPAYVEPIPGRVYVVFWDPSVASDPTAAYVLDVTAKPWVVVQEVYNRKSQGVHELVSRMQEVHSSRGNAEDPATRIRSSVITGFDETSMGGAMIRQMLSRMSPQRPINFGGTGQVKLDALTNLRAALLSGDLIVPDEYIGLKREILNYRLADKDITQDRVMALAGAAWIAAKGFSGVMKAAFQPSGYVAPLMRR